MGMYLYAEQMRQPLWISGTAMGKTAIMSTDSVRCWNMLTRHRSGFPLSSVQVMLQNMSVPDMAAIAAMEDMDVTTTAVTIKPVLRYTSEAVRYLMPMCPVLRFWETGTPRTHFMYTGVEKY